MTVPNVQHPAPGEPITGGMEKDELQAALLHPPAAGGRRENFLKFIKFKFFFRKQEQLN